MLNLDPAISKIEELLKEGTEATITYAALECRLAIERICYERLRLAHDYISHDDLKKWQPRDIVKILIQEVDSSAAETFTVSISTSVTPEGTTDLTLADYQAMDYSPIGTQVGFNPNKLGRLWNALANLALHISLPINKADNLRHYGDKEAVSKKVSEALAEIKRISEGTLMFTGLGEEVSFSCECGSTNKRRLELLSDGQIVSCVKADCGESYRFAKSDLLFERRTFEIVCQICDTRHHIAKKRVQKLRTDQPALFFCEGCGDTIQLSWRLNSGQKIKTVDPE
ncbi:hypothetical protein [Sulfitobacter pontiacus]|uniref:hypothetical protein n=1 Tax=Sulfitobacter pontiacus TaxID=60137 RepID=UPI0030ED9AE8|tara:strand:+ start:4709 stop:5560 length:852 start_codon:yes stop_codon:yes gene_type:complete